jgi:predicted anti-sigma-YlaC factor YlaD
MTDVQELTCKEIVELVNDYLGGSMSRSDRERFEQHLAACDGCTIYLRQMKTTIELSGRLGEESLPEDVRRDLVDAFRRWKRS